MRVVNDLVGKTIQSAEAIQAEFGRTYEAYLCLVFSDGTRGMIGVVGNGLDLYNPDPQVTEMMKAPKYFSPDDIADKVRENETKVRAARKEARARKMREYKTLQKELGLTSPETP